MITLNLAFLILLVSLQLLDAYSTYLGIATGKAHEANPVMKKLFGSLGLVPALVITKGLFAAGVIYWHSEIGAIGLAILCVGYLFVVCHNFKILKENNE